MIHTPGGFIRADDRQVSGDHYKTMSVQPWTLMEALLTREEFIGFLKGNAIKYGMRQGRKEGSDDAGKAEHYLQKLKEVQSPKQDVAWQTDQRAGLRPWDKWDAKKEGSLHGK